MKKLLKAIFIRVFEILISVVLLDFFDAAEMIDLFLSFMDGEGRFNQAPPNTGMEIYQAPSPGARVEVFEIPETPHSGASEAEPGPSEPGQPANFNPLRTEVELDLIRILQKLEATALQEAKFKRLLTHLDLEKASDELLIALKGQILEIEKAGRPRNRNKAIGILENFIKNWNSQDGSH